MIKHATRCVLNRMDPVHKLPLVLYLSLFLIKSLFTGSACNAFSVNVSLFVSANDSAFAHFEIHVLTKLVVRSCRIACLLAGERSHFGVLLYSHIRNG